MCLIHSATRSSALGAHSAASLQPSKIEIELYSVEKNNKKPACIKTRLLVNCPPVAFLTRKRAGKKKQPVCTIRNSNYKKEGGKKNIYTHTYIYIYNIYMGVLYQCVELGHSIGPVPHLIALARSFCTKYVNVYFMRLFLSRCGTNKRRWLHNAESRGGPTRSIRILD